MEAILQKEQDDRDQMARDMEMFIKEHEAGQHKDGIVPFCEKCEEERDNHDCHTSQEDGCAACDKRYQCKVCKDTGVVEVYGGSDADEWGVVDTKTCICRKE